MHTNSPALSMAYHTYSVMMMDLNQYKVSHPGMGRNGRLICKYQ